MVTNSSTKEGHITEDDLKIHERRALCSPSNYKGGICEQARTATEYGFSADFSRRYRRSNQTSQTMKSGGAKAILQLACHAGRFASHALNH